MIRTPSGYANSHTNSVHTPGYITESLKKEFGVDSLFDPCPYDPLWNKLTSTDGLAIDWPAPVVFVNPPYRNPKPWLLKAREVWHTGVTVILLLKAEVVGSRYFKYSEGAEIRFINHHIRFPQYKKKAPFSNMLVVFHANKIMKTWCLTDMRSEHVN